MHRDLPINCKDDLVQTLPVKHAGICQAGSHNAGSDANLKEQRGEEIRP